MRRRAAPRTHTGFAGALGGTAFAWARGMAVDGRVAFRERVLRDGAERSDDEALVAVVLGTGVRGAPVSTVARAVLDRAGGVAELGRLGGGALAAVPGVGPTKAARLLAAVELGRRSCARPLAERRPVTRSAEVYDAFRPWLAEAAEERFLALALDVRRRLLRPIEVARGSLVACPVSPAAVYRALLAEAAAAVIFVHNHPSGDPSPSPEDVAMTERLARAGALLGVQVEDHVVIAREGWFSFRDAGLLPGP